MLKVQLHNQLKSELTEGWNTFTAKKNIEAD